MHNVVDRASRKVVLFLAVDVSKGDIDSNICSDLYGHSLHDASSTATKVAKGKAPEQPEEKREKT